MTNPSPFRFLIPLLIGLWIYGFVGFVDDVQAMREPGIEANLGYADAPTDAIVVLTGGSERVMTGLELLESGKGKKLFISGVHKNLNLDEILGSQPVPPPLRECCIALGYQAGSTKGNAGETRDWMQQEGYKSLRLVTANYHMKRSLLLFHQAMPDIAIIPYPVAPESVILSEWWQHPRTFELLAIEYNKFLIATLGTKVSEQ